MEIDQNPNVGQKGRFYLTKNIWLPQEPIEKLNLKMSDMILRRMPKLPLGGDDALRCFRCWPNSGRATTRSRPTCSTC